MEELQARKNCKYLSNAELSFLAQRAKSNNLNHLDKNSKYFHAVVKGTSACNAIAFIHRSDSSITGDMNTIIGDFFDFYGELFGKAKPRNAVDWTVFEKGPTLSLEEQASLTMGITKEEIKEAIFGIGNEKAPGPDGFPASFFRKELGSSRRGYDEWGTRILQERAHT